MSKLFGKDLQTFYTAAETIKEDYTEDKLKALIQSYEAAPQEELIRDRDKAKIALTGLPLKFYDRIAENINEHINSFPEYWFMYDSRIAIILNQNNYTYVVNKIIDRYHGTNSEFVYQGLMAMSNESYDLALLYFNHSNHYIISYLKGYCYLGLKNAFNAIKNFERFIEGVKHFITDPGFSDDGFDPAQNMSLKSYRAEVYRELGFLYNETNQFSLALNSFESAFKLCPLEEAFWYSEFDENDAGFSEFEFLIRNYLFTLDKLGKNERQSEVLEEAIQIQPENSTFQKILKEIEERIARHKTADEILKNVVRRKLPFNVEVFRKTRALAREKVLEDLIVEQIKYGFEVFGRKLELYQDETVYGRQYHVKGASGFLDLLLIDKRSDTLYVVELKRGLAGEEVIHQIESYMSALSEEMGREVKGIICLHQANEELKSLVKSKRDIELFIYKFDFKRLG